MRVCFYRASWCMSTENGKIASDAMKKIFTSSLPVEMASVRIFYLLKADGALILSYG